MRSNSVTSISSASSRASSAEAEDTMQIFVKNIAGETFPVTIPQSTSVGNLRSLLALRTNLPESQLRIVHAGKHLSSPTAPLSDYNITRESTLHLALPVRGGGPKRPRCAHKECREMLPPFTPECTFCNGKFCSKHRMLEGHACEGLERAKEEDKARNREKLESEKTQAIKGI